MAASRIARALARVWFSSLRREGPALPPGPCLILLNHPNGLLDPLAAAALLDRRAGWLAKATLWKLAPLRPFLAAFRAIPVTRPKDGGATPESIQQSFRKVHEVLAAGGSVAMFPEGVSHSSPDLQPLKTGAARMALSSPVPLSIVPAGLAYGDRAAFRHSVLLRIGEPVSWGDLSGGGADPQSVTLLTARIREALRPLTLHDAEARCLALAQDVAWLWAGRPANRADLEALRRRVRALIPRLSGLPPGEREALAHRVREIQDRLRERGVRLDQVGHPYAGAEIRRWLPGAAVRLAAAGALLLPALPFWPSYRLVHLLGTRFTDEGDQVATLKFLGGLLAHPLWALVLAGLGGALGGTWVAFLPPLALGAVTLGLPLLERAGEDLQAIRGFLRRKDPAGPELAEARQRLLAAFPELEQI